MRRVSESRSSYANRRTSTYECALHGDRIDGTDIPSARQDARTRLYTHAIAYNHALRCRDAALLRPLPLPTESRGNSRSRRRGPPRRELVTREWSLRGRGLRNPASRMPAFRRESAGRCFFPGRDPPDHALIRRSSGSCITPRDRYRGGVAVPGSRRGGCRGLSLIYRPITSIVYLTKRLSLTPPICRPGCEVFRLPHEDLPREMLLGDQ